MSFRNKDIRMNLFDLAGDTAFHEVRTEFYQDSHGALLVFDVTSVKSYRSLRGWLLELLVELRKLKHPPTFPLVVCGNKVGRGFSQLLIFVHQMLNLCISIPVMCGH